MEPGSVVGRASGWAAWRRAGEAARMLPDHTDAVMSGAGCAALALTWSCVDSDTDLPCAPQLPSEAP